MENGKGFRKKRVRAEIRCSFLQSENAHPKENKRFHKNIRRPLN